MYRLLPAFGLLIFVGLYIWAAFLYPGGSQFDPGSTGFSWSHNYWCNLLYEEAINGVRNPARPYAIVGMGFLCGSLALFFYRFPKYYSINVVWNRLIKISGILSMLLAISISTTNHDLMTTLSSIAGLFTLVGIFIGLLKYKLIGFMFSAVICILLLAINNYIYHSGHYWEFLPIVQKITFAIFLTWIIALNFTFLKRSNLYKE